MTTEKKQKKLHRIITISDLSLPLTGGLSIIPLIIATHKLNNMLDSELNAIDDVSEACLNTINVMFEEIQD